MFFSSKKYGFQFLSHSINVSDQFSFQQLFHTLKWAETLGFAAEQPWAGQR